MKRIWYGGWKRAAPPRVYLVMSQPDEHLWSVVRIPDLYELAGGLTLDEANKLVEKKGYRR